MSLATLAAPGIDVHTIVDRWRARRLARSPLIEQMRLITQHYDNDVAVPLPEVSKRELPAVANFFSIGIDQYAMRMASVLPELIAPPRKKGVQRSEQLAATRRRVALGFWEQNGYDLQLYRRFRWLIAYSCSPVKVIPDLGMEGPRWVLRNPAEAYPSDEDPECMTPRDCLFGYARTVGWLRARFPDIDLSGIVVDRSAKGLMGGSRHLQPDDPIDLIEHVDGQETVQIAVGVGKPVMGSHLLNYGVGGAQIVDLGSHGGQDTWAVELRRVANRTGVCPVVMPGRITLGKPKGQFDDNVGLFQQMAMLTAMEVSAVAEAIWPDQWIVSRPNETANIIRTADGRRGVLGQIEGAAIEAVQIQPGMQTNPTIDRLERAQRITSGIAPEMGGESGSNIRTGRRGDAVLGAAIDYTIQEAQKIMARSAQHELNIAAAVDLTYFGRKRKSFYVQWKGGGRLDYTPREVWTEDRTLIVDYANAGVDATELNVQLGQMVGSGMMSTLTAMRTHPMVKDAEFESDQIVYEQLERGLLGQMPALLQSGAFTTDDYVRVMELVRSDKMTVEEAFRKAQDEAQARQAAAAQAAAGSAQAQPGMNQPGADAAIPAQAPSAKNLTSLLRGLTTQSRAAANL